MPKPTYSKQELVDWLYSQADYHLLYDNWQRLDFQTAYAPSVDRIDDLIGYTMSNIQLMTFKANQLKPHRGGKATRAIVQINLSGEVVKGFSSIAEAHKSTGTNRANIIAVCKGYREKAGGYHWSYEGGN